MVLQIMPAKDLAQTVVYIQLTREVTEADKLLKIKYSVLTALPLRKVHVCCTTDTSLLFHLRLQLNKYFFKDQSPYV